MDLQAARSALARVNRLFDDLTEDGAPASALERDLLREYVRRLYETLVEGGAPAQPTAKAESAHRSRPAPTPAPAPVRKAQIIPDPTPDEQPAPAFAFEPSPAAVAREDVEPPEPTAPAKPRVFDVPDDVEQEVRAIEAKRTAHAPQAPRPVTRPVAEAPAMESPFAPEPAELPTAIRELFAVDRSSSDLSARLSSSPVPDLARAFGIGERMLIQKELFGGNQDTFSAALRHLNDLPSYDDAVAYLGGGVAKEYDWADGERADVARDFAKVVRRRYA